MRGRAVPAVRARSLRAGVVGLLLCGAAAPAVAAGPDAEAGPDLEAGPDAEAGRPAFWSYREASYREKVRGPFTAIWADYLKPGEEVVLRATDGALRSQEDGNRADPAAPGEAGMRITFGPDGFTVAPLPGLEAPTMGGEPVTAPVGLGEEAWDEEDVRLGRYLLSFDRQGEELGRALAYDPDVLEDRFHGFPVFPEDDRLRIRARLVPADHDTVTLGTTRGRTKPFVRVVFLDFEVDGTACRLSGFQSPGVGGGGLFVPFRDETSGSESYGVGRYLHVVMDPAENTVTLDFNGATNPWCAYSPFYNCVLPPAENRLPVAIRAGEKAPRGH